MIQANAVQEAFKLALSMTLFYWLALRMNWTNTSDGALAIALISLATTGASLNKGLMRVGGLGLGSCFGLLLVAWFPQERWFFLIAMTTYLVGVGYFIQLSQRKYAWMMMAMGALFTWVASYQHAASAFGPAFDKFAVTAAGVLIYTLVSIVFWPKRAGATLESTGKAHIADIQKLLATARSPEEQPQEIASRMTGTVPRLLAGIREASLDSPGVAQRKQTWHLIGLHVRAVTDAAQFWLPSMELAERADLARHYPTLDQDMDRLQARLRACANRWSIAAQAAQDDRDETFIPSKPPMLMDLASVSLTDRAKLLNLAHHVQLLDAAILRLLESLRMLEEPRIKNLPRAEPDIARAYRPALWDPERLLKGMFPAACFVCAFVFWIYSANPPGGTALPMLSGVLAFAVLLAPIKLIGLLIYLLISAVAILPIYLWLMPALPQGGGSILGLVFAYTFGVAMLGVKSQALRFGPLLMFFVVTGITNHQSYSFMGFVNLASMLLLAGIIVAVVNGLVHAMRPEAILRRSIKRFAYGCTQILNTYGDSTTTPLGRSAILRKRYYDSMVQSGPAQVGLAAKGLEYDRLEGCTPEKVQRILQGMQSVALRLQALEFRKNDTSALPGDLQHALVPLSIALRSKAKALLQDWQDLDDSSVALDDMKPLQDCLVDLNRVIDSSLGQDNPDRDEQAQALANAYSMLGSIQLLLESLTETREALEEIDWNQLAMARF